MATTTIDWTSTRNALASAQGIAWDGCHKIYVLLDDAQVKEMRDLGYEPLLITGLTAEQYLPIVQKWFEESCGLRFINAVKTVKGNPNDGFTDLIAQFRYEEA